MNWPLALLVKVPLSVKVLELVVLLLPGAIETIGLNDAAVVQIARNGQRGRARDYGRALHVQDAAAAHRQRARTRRSGGALSVLEIQFTLDTVQVGQRTVGAGLECPSHLQSRS